MDRACKYKRQNNKYGEQPGVGPRPERPQATPPTNIFSDGKEALNERKERVEREASTLQAFP